MSRVGKAIVTIPPKVEIKDNGNSILVKGPLGEISTPIFEGISLNQENETVSFVRSSEQKKIIALHGLVRALFNNSVKGVTEGWTRNLEITGVGYRAQVRGKDLVMSLGYSHEVVFPTPNGIKIEVADQKFLESTANWSVKLQLIFVQNVLQNHIKEKEFVILMKLSSVRLERQVKNKP